MFQLLYTTIRTICTSSLLGCLPDAVSTSSGRGLNHVRVDVDTSIEHLPPAQSTMSSCLVAKQGL
jgi:hypothetical protein